MPRPDMRDICAALGFTAVVMKEDAQNSNQFARAACLARTIEEFCNLLRQDEPVATLDGEGSLDKAIEMLKADMAVGKSPSLPRNENGLRNLLSRLQRRHRSYATEDILAEEITHMLYEEIRYEKDSGASVADLCAVLGEAKLVKHKGMASAIAEVLATKGECFPDDLLEKGFQKEQISREWSIAYGLAKIESLLLQG